MADFIRTAAIIGIVMLCGCASHQSASVNAKHGPSCTDRATQIVETNETTIAAHRYSAASLAAERAARVSLSCAAAESSAAAQFADRWRAANALVVAAELAHQASDAARAHRLLHEGYTIMHALRPPSHVSAVTSTLLAQKLDTARRDMQGEWAYW